MNTVYAQITNQVPEVNLNAPQNADNPWGAFKLSQCDGPDLKGLTMSITIDLNGKTVATTPGKNPDGYVPCNFQGVMTQAQFLINAMMVVGVIAALAGFAYAGLLYISGDPKKISQAHGIFPKVFWGFVIMLTGWFIVHQILVWLTGSSAYLPG